MVVTGKLMKVAQVFDEFWQRAVDLPAPSAAILALKEHETRPDVFTFSQRLPDSVPSYPYRFEMENVAAARVSSYQIWFEKEADRSVRKHVRKAEREGITVRVVPFDDQFVAGIKSIYDEVPVRQGRRFWHYHKTFDQVKRENSTYGDRSVYLGAFVGEYLVGFAKFVVDGSVASIMQILSRVEYAAKRPTNALIAKAVDECAQRGIDYLIYGAHTYGRNTDTSLIEFKEKNGFRKYEIPRYYVPLTHAGRFGLALGLHRDVQDLVPPAVKKMFRTVRSKLYGSKT